MSDRPQPAITTTRHVVTVWWPLAASWMFMAVEMPLVSAVLARLANPEVQLAAFGGLVFPLMLLIESPVIMLLAASTALSRDWPSYLSLRRYMTQMSVVLTLLHVAVATTPLYGWVTTTLIDAPPEIVGPARIGILVSIPWTWAIAYRRFNQGLLIRHGASRAVGVGTLVRLTSTSSVLAAGFWLAPRFDLPGVAVGTSGVMVGVLAEAAYVRGRSRPVIEDFLLPGEEGEPLPVGEFLRFYVPLALTSLLSLVVQPIGSAAMSRMPLALPSLAAWPVVAGLVFLLRAGATAYKEVVVAMLDRPGAYHALRRFTLWLFAATLALAFLFALTPLSGIWLRTISGLSGELAALAATALVVGVLMPAVGVLQNWYVGYLVHARRTRHVTESMALYLLVACSVLAGGIWLDRVSGLYVALAAFTVGNCAQAGWVWWCSREGMRELAAQTAEGAAATDDVRVSGGRPDSTSDR